MLIEGLISGNVDMWLVLALRAWKAGKQWKRLILLEVIGPVSLITAAYRGCSIYIIVMSFFWVSHMILNKEYPICEFAPSHLARDWQQSSRGIYTCWVGEGKSNAKLPIRSAHPGINNNPYVAIIPIEYGLESRRRVQRPARAHLC
jgi:hypothetical protein